MSLINTNNDNETTLGFNFFDSVVECMDFVNSTERDEQWMKQDVIEGIRARLSIMISRITLWDSTHAGSHSVRGWKIEENPH